MTMAKPVERNLKRKRKGSSFPNTLKSPNLPHVIQSATVLVQKIGQNNTQQELLTPKRTIKMLIRGLGSSNTQVQKNYFAVLVALLKSFNSSSEFSVGNVLEIITTELHATGRIKKGEEREILMGRVLVFGVLARSGVLQSASEEEKTTLLTQFLQDIKEKSYLPLVGDPFLIELLRQADKQSFESTIWPLLSQEVRPGPDQTLLIYHCLMVCADRFPSVVTPKYLKQTLGCPSVLSPTTVHGLMEAVKGEHKHRTLDHPAFSDIFKYLVSSEEVLTSFWQEVEKHLLLETTLGNNKPVVALKIFSIIVSQLQDASQVLTLLTPKLLAWFMKKSRSPGPWEKYFNRIARDGLQSVLTLCTKTGSSKTSYSVLKKLIFNPGSVLFDQLSGTKIVAQLVRLLKEKQAHQLTEVLRDLITGTRLAVEHKDGDETTRLWTNKEKLYAVHLLCRLLNITSQNNLPWKLQQLTFLFDMGFFPTTNIGVELAGSIRESFFSSLNQKSSSINDLQEILSGVVEHINKRFSNGDQLRIKVPSEVLPAWNKMYKVARQLNEGKKVKEEGARLAKVFQTMFYHIGLHLFKEAAFAKDVLQELHSAYDRVDKSTHSEEEPHWTEVVTEMFLSLLSRNSHRNLLNCIFSNFCHILTPQNIHQILQVLDPTNNTNPLLNSLDSDSESDSEEDGSEDEVDDKEEDESSDDGMTDGDDDLEEDMEEKVNDKLRRAVIDALGDTGAMTDTESVDLDKMDEDEANRVDKALSAAFQAFKPTRKKKETSHIKALAHFRSRVLDLIEVWMARVEKPPLDLTVDVLLRLITLLEYSLVDKHQSQLETRIRSVIKKLTSSMSKKTFDTEYCKALHLGNILKSLLEKGERTTTVYMSVYQELIDTTIFIVKVSQHVPSGESDTSGDSSDNVSVYSVLKEAINSYFTQRDCLIPMKLFPALFTLNFPFLVKLAAKLPVYAFDPNVPSFRQSKAVEFLILLWKNNRIINKPSEDVLETLRKISKKLYKNSVKMIAEPKGRVQEKFLNELKRAFKLIQKYGWLADVVDSDQHAKNLQEFHQSLNKMRNVNAPSVAASNEEMEVENCSSLNEKHKKKFGLEKQTVKEEESDHDESESEGDENESGNTESDDESVDEEAVQTNENKMRSLDKQVSEDSEEESSDDDMGDESEEEEEELSDDEETSGESPSESEEPPSKKAKKKVDKKKNREKLRRIQLLKNNSKKLRMESMSAGLDENLFSKYRLLQSKKSASPER